MFKMTLNNAPEWKERDTLLGSGGFGNVRLFFNKDGDYLVVKECKPKTMTEKMKERWKNECEIMLKLDHPYIVKSVTLPDELIALNSSANPVLPMEYCNSGDLRKELNHPHNMYGLEEFQVKAIIHDISSAIQYLHEMRIYHRDLKPENIVLHKLDGRRIVYKIIDLGYAKKVNHDSICNSFVGTIQYLAPELLISSKPVYTGTVDFWSLGTTVFECISGFRPFMHFNEVNKWLHAVESKSDRDIYAFLSNSESIIYSEHLPRNNKIASTSQQYFEDWLRLMLTFDQKLRGGQKANNVPSCYLKLDDLFKHKPLHVFNPLTNESHFYDVLNNESLKTLRDLILTFRNIPEEQITFITTTGLVVHQNSYLLDYCTPVNYDSEQEFDEVDMDLILIYPTFELPEKKLIRGQRLDQLKNGKQNYYDVSDQRKLSKHLTYYCWTIYRSFQYLSKSTEGVKLWLLREKTDFAELIKALNESAIMLLAKVELFSESLRVDAEKTKKLSYDSNLSALIKLQNDRINDWKQLIENADFFIGKYNGTECRIIEYMKKPCAEHSDRENKMINYFKDAREIINALKDSSAEQVGMNKVTDILNCLHAVEEEWAQLSRENRSHIRHINGLCKEVMHIKSPIKELVIKLKASSEELTSAQINRQTEIWKIIEKQAESGLHMEATRDLVSEDLCLKSRTLIDKVQIILSEKMPIIEPYDWSFLEQ